MILFLREAFFYLVLALSGHLSGALFFYFVHRYIFHGKLRKLRIFKKAARIHSLHHARPQDLENYRFPKPIIALIAIFLFFVSYFSLSFGIGISSFFALYSLKHKLAHFGPETKWTLHHRDHHSVHPQRNFSGVYPIIDRIFGTQCEYEKR